MSPHIVLFGPPGTGKTHMIRTACETLGVPFATISATALIEGGAGSARVLSRLLSAADGDSRRAAIGVVLISGLESLCTASMRLRQDDLFHLLDGAELDVPIDPSHPLSRTVRLNTRRILFVGELTLDRRTIPDRLCSGPADSFKLLRKRGLTESLVERFCVLGESAVLGIDSLVEILDAAESPLWQSAVKYGFRKDGLALEPAARRSLARHVYQSSYGARYLHRTCDVVFEQIVHHHLHRPLELSEELVEQILTEEPELVPPTQSQRAPVHSVASAMNASTDPLRSLEPLRRESTQESNL